MESSPVDTSVLRNTVLQGLSPGARETVLRPAAQVELVLGRMLYRHEADVEHVYFPERGIISMVASTAAGAQVETGVVGVNGALGLFEALTRSPVYPTATVQAPGLAWRVPAAACREAFAEGPARLVADRLLLMSTAEARQSVACQAFHLLEARLARWLLECRDRSGAGDELPLTQEFMSIMLGVQRTSVTAAIATLETRGLVAPRRGKVRILDVAGLEASACECRAAIDLYREQLFQRPAPTGACA